MHHLVGCRGWGGRLVLCEDSKVCGVTCPLQILAERDNHTQLHPYFSCSMNAASRSKDWDGMAVAAFLFAAGHSSAPSCHMHARTHAHKHARKHNQKRRAKRTNPSGNNITTTATTTTITTTSSNSQWMLLHRLKSTKRRLRFSETVISGRDTQTFFALRVCNTLKTLKFGRARRMYTAHG